MNCSLCRAAGEALGSPRAGLEQVVGRVSEGAGEVCISLLGDLGLLLLPGNQWNQQCALSIGVDTAWC